MHSIGTQEQLNSFLSHLWTGVLQTMHKSMIAAGRHPTSALRLGTQKKTRTKLAAARLTPSSWSHAPARTAPAA